MHLVTSNSTHPIAWESELKGLWALWKLPFVALGFFNLGEKREQNPPPVTAAEGKERGHSSAKEGGWAPPERGRSPCPPWRSSPGVTEAGGDALWAGPALQGPALVLTGVEQSREQYVALLSHLLPIRLRWGGDCAVFLFKMICNWGMRACKRRSPPSFLFGWALVCLFVQSEDPAAITCAELLAASSSLWGYGGKGSAYHIPLLL